MMRSFPLRSVLGAALSVSLISCSGKEPTPPVVATAEGPAFPEGVSAAISDASRPNGTAGFNWLPPLSPRRTSYPAAFDATLSPTVEVCEWVAEACARVVATMTTAGTTDGKVTVNPRLEAYETVWRTRRGTLDNKTTYRVRVSVGGRVFGFADVDVLKNAWGLFGVDLKNFFPLLAGLDLPIRFRLTQGIVAPAPEPARPGATVATVQFGSSVSPALRSRVGHFVSSIDAQPGSASGGFVSLIGTQALQWVLAVDRSGIPLLAATPRLGSVVQLDAASTAHALISAVYGTLLNDPGTDALSVVVRASEEYAGIITAIGAAQDAGTSFFESATLRAQIRALAKYVPAATVRATQRAIQPSLNLGRSPALAAVAASASLPTFPVSTVTLVAPAENSLSVQSSSLAAFEVSYSDASGQSLGTGLLQSGPSRSVDLTTTVSDVTVRVELGAFGTPSGSANNTRLASVLVQSVLVLTIGGGTNRTDYGSCLTSTVVGLGATSWAEAARSGSSTTLAEALGNSAVEASGQVAACSAAFVAAEGLPALAAAAFATWSTYVLQTLNVAIIIYREGPFLADYAQAAFNNPMAVSACRQDDGFYAAECNSLQLGPATIGPPIATYDPVTFWKVVCVGSIPYTKKGSSRLVPLPSTNTYYAIINGARVGPFSPSYFPGWLMAAINDGPPSGVVQWADGALMGGGDGVHPTYPPYFEGVWTVNYAFENDPRVRTVALAFACR